MAVADCRFPPKDLVCRVLWGASEPVSFDKLEAMARGGRGDWRLGYMDHGIQKAIGRLEFSSLSFRISLLF